MTWIVPGTPLRDDIVGQIAHRYRLPSRMKRARHMLDHKYLDHLLRSHLAETIEEDEINERDNLDELLAGLSILHIGGLDRRDNLATVGIELEDVLRLLENSSVSRYFEDYYPFAPPVLLRESARDPAGKDYTEELASERCRDGWLEAFHQFVSLDAAFNAPDPLDIFLAVMDSYTVNRLDLGDLEKAFRSKDRMRRLIKRKTGRLLLEGLQDFFEFSEELEEALEAWERFPLFSGLVWLNYGYWYGAGGKRMRKVANWVQGTIDMVALDDGHHLGANRAEYMRQLMRRLTDLDGHPRYLLERCALPLERWMRNVKEQRAADNF